MKIEMETIRTGVYKTRTIRYKEEWTLSKEQLEKSIEKDNQFIEERKDKPKWKSNVESLERMVKTAQMLIEGHKYNEIAPILGLKDSTVIGYMRHFDLSLR